MADSGAPREIVDRCPVCGSPDRAPFLPTADVLQCLACDTLYVSPRPTAAAIGAFYSAAGRYDRWDAERGRASMWRRRLAVVCRLAPCGGRLLDVGTGQGDFAALARTRFEVEATEISSEGGRLACERHGLRVHQGSLPDLMLPAGRYDAITLWHVLEHVPNPGAIAVECHRLLRDGGVLVAAVPNADAQWQLTRRFWADALRFARSRPPLDDCRVAGIDHALWLMLGEMPPRMVGISRIDLNRADEEIHLTHFTLDTLAHLLAARGFDLVERGVDDHSPDQSVRARVGHRRQAATYRITGRPASQAIFVAARKRR